MEEKQVLKNINVSEISSNKDNPRIFFRQEELDNLMVSINKIGLQVPISVYFDNGKYIIIDGERRWTVCKKLNHKTIPAMIKPKPTKLENLLLMFNIHALREQWDILTIALKLPRVIELFNDKFKHYPSETELSNETGLSRGTIRRCNLIIELPERFKSMLLEDLKKPKSKQLLSEDLFLEIEGALKTVTIRYPNFRQDIDNIRDILLKKYINKTIYNIVDLRKIKKIATAPEHLNFPQEKVINALNDIFGDNHISIEQIYNETVGNLYDERKFILTADLFLNYLKELDEEEKNDSDIMHKLSLIRETIDKLLR